MTTPRGVVFIWGDHHRHDYLGAAGADFVSTPHLDALAARGTRVTGCYSNAPLCVPQRIALTSGRYPSQTGCFSNRHAVDAGIPTFLHRLRAAGVRTALIGKFHHHVHVKDADFTAHEADLHRLGFDDVHETSGKTGVGPIACECRYARYLRGLGLLEEYREWTGRWGETPGSGAPHEAWRWDEETTQDAYIAAQACRHIAEMPLDKPFYLQIGFVGPHPNFDAPARYREFYENTTPPNGAADAAAWRAYGACISEVDEMLGRVLAALQERGILDDTVVIYSSDHGDEAGDHGRWGKVTFYEGSAHVPLLAAGPGIAAGQTTQALAEVLDIGATACEFLGTTSHALDQGQSLAPLLRGQSAAHRSDVFAEMGSDKMLFDGRYKLMYGDLTRDTRTHWQHSPYHGPAFGRPVNLPPDQISLYDLQNDPHEERDLAGEPAHAALLATMKEKLLLRFIANARPAPADSGSVL